MKAVWFEKQLGDNQDRTTHRFFLSVENVLEKLVEAG